MGEAKHAETGAEDATGQEKENCRAVKVFVGLRDNNGSGRFDCGRG